MYLLDTDTCIYVLNNRSKQLRHKFKVTKELGISAITYAELCFGIENSAQGKRKQRREQLDLFAQLLQVLPFDERAAADYASIRSDLKQKGQMIGNNDLLIAAHARSIDAVLVSNNLKEFERVEGLTVENWL